MPPIDRRWEVLRTLTQGGQAQTFIVRDLQDGSEGWVLKRFGNRERLERFRREVDALALANSPRIPSPRAFSLGEPAYVVLPYLGPDLKNHPLVPTISIEDALTLFEAIVDGVADAHRAGIVHRDLKPNNIVSPEGRLEPYIIDFGICQYIDRQLTTLTNNEALGNAAFAAPECFLGSVDEPTAACDVYSLGKILYWLASHGNYINRERLDPVALSRIATNSDVKRQAIVRLIRRCVVEDHQARPSIQDLKAAVLGTQSLFATYNAYEARGLVVLTDLFGPRDTFYSHGSRSATSPPRGYPPRHHDLAELLLVPPDQDYELSTVHLALCSVTGTPARATVSVSATNGDDPDDSAILAQTTVQVGREPRCYDIEMPAGARLVAGSQLWLRLSAPDPNSEIAWWVAPIDFVPLPETFAERDDRQPWVTRTSPTGPGLAMRVTARPIPAGADSRP